MELVSKKMNNSRPRRGTRFPNLLATAAALGCHYQHLSKVLRGERRCTPAMRHKLAAMRSPLLQFVASAAERRGR